MLPEGAEPPIRPDRLNKLRKNSCRAAKRERARLQSCRRC
jgi:hypothetical protein